MKARYVAMYSFQLKKEEDTIVPHFKASYFIVFFCHFE